MAKGKVSFTLSVEDLELILAAVKTILEKLPFLLALSPKERKSILKAGPKSEGFLLQIAALSKEHPELVPPAVDVIEFQKDAQLFDSLGKFSAELTSLAEAVEDTRMVAGSEAMATGLMLYGMFQAAKRQVPGMDEVMTSVGARFSRKPRKDGDSGKKKE